jgi:hypothetical protein
MHQAMEVIRVDLHVRLVGRTKSVHEGASETQHAFVRLVKNQHAPKDEVDPLECVQACEGCFLDIGGQNKLYNRAPCVTMLLDEHSHVCKRHILVHEPIHRTRRTPERYNR